ncbi:MAG: AMP-binding protein [Hyphomicrobiaceae bacterium]
MQAFYDNLETREREVRERSQFGLLPDLIARAAASAPGWARHLAGCEPAAVTSREALASLPVLRKSALKTLQAESPPFGGLAASEPARIGRMLVSPGPIHEPEGLGEDWWRTGRALFAAGFRPGEVVLNTFAYHMTPGGWILDAGARAVGCAVIPAGPGNSEQQLQVIGHFRPVGYVGVPDFLKILIDKAAETGADISSIRRAFVSGGALFPSLRELYRSRGITVAEAYATADLGLIAYQSLVEGEPTGGMIVDEGVIVEIVRPGTGDPVGEGEVGEVVVTSFNRDYPMIRLATGDLSAVLAGVSPCGRTNMRLKGWMGRADQTTKVKGMFVHPEQVAEIGKRHGELKRLRLVVTRAGEQDEMTLRAECDTPGDQALSARIAETLQTVTRLRGRVELVAPGTLANDGRVIADERPAT